MKKQTRFVAIFIAVAFVVTLVPAVYAQDEKININTASLEELTKLVRIGEKYAQRIIDYREQHGPFETPEDITKVPGIGPKIFEANKDRIVVE